LSPVDQAALSAEVGRETMDAGGYAEAFTSSNPFEATVAAGKDQMDLAKLRLHWTHRFSDRVDSTLWVAGVYQIDRDVQLTANIAGFGVMTPTRNDDATWVEYGGRIGFKVRDDIVIDAFANGVAGGNGVDSTLHAGADVRFKF
jgi:hypothetical protein